MKGAASFGFLIQFSLLTYFQKQKVCFVGHYLCYDSPTKTEKGLSAMFVLLDMEWIEDRYGHRSLTQLYAARVDEKWNTSCVFDALVCPRDPWTAPWDHMAFSGYAPDEFRASDPEESCVRRFFRWLQPDDVICCWHVETKNTLKALYRRYLFGTFSATVRCMDQKVYAAIKARGIPARSLYKIAEACGLSTPAPEHRSSNDAAVMQMLFQALELAQPKAQKRVQAKEPISGPERNAKIIETSDYNYLYAPDSEVFHCRSCKQLLRVKELLGSVYYQTASKNRRPCKLCHPDLQPIIERPPKKHAETTKPELVKARLLGNQCVLLPQTRIVGCCHNLLHPGKLTKRLLTQHDCLGKNCNYFEKYEDAGYWKECDRKKEQKQAARELKRMKREREAAADAELQSLAELFQSYIDDAGYAMRIVRIDTERTDRYRVFYVSEYPFADGNRFPKFLETVRFFFPDYRLELRHIRDVDGHFVTIEEYRQRVRK